MAAIQLRKAVFFEVDNLAAAFEEIRGTPPKESDLSVEKSPGVPYRVFFEVAPDGLCYMLGEPIRLTNAD